MGGAPFGPNPDPPPPGPEPITVVVTADAPSDQQTLGSDIGSDVVQPRIMVGGAFPKAIFKALLLVLNPDCANFLQSVGQSALLAAAGMKPGAPFLPNYSGQYTQSIYNNYTGLQVALTAYSATANNQAGTNPTAGTYTTVAEISGPNTMSFYKMFNAEVPNAQAQTLLHEGSHLLSGGTDQQLAAAAGVPNAANMGISEASSKFQQALEKKCHSK